MMLVIGALLVIGLIGGTILTLRAQVAAEHKRNMLSMINPDLVMSGKHDTGKAADQAKAREKRLRQLSSDTQVKKKNSLRVQLARAGLSLSMTQVVMLSLGSGMIVAALAAAFTKTPAAILLAFLTGAFGVPRLVMNMKAAKRRKLFMADMAEALEAMGRLLRSGLPVGEAIAMCAREFGGPLGDEMRRIYDAQKIGVPLSEAVQEAAERMPLPEMRMMATAFAIQQQTGSSLSDVLESLATMIRARQRLRRKIVALSSEAKASSAIIGALPIFVALSLKLVNPEYIALLFETPLGKILLGAAIGMMLTGILVMRQMINFRI